MTEPSKSRQVAVRFSGVHRRFGEVAAVDDVNLEVYDGEFFSLLGPSGSGKTTCLRLIAGFEQPSSGSIQLYGQEMTGIPPYERDVNTVFQDYALFPHMNVGDNIGYGLMIKKVDKQERRRRVAEMLELVRLPDVANRKPSQLSGGQRQRIALARALINHPRVLLLDEPLGALDLKLRQQMQIELKAIQEQVGITFIFVTHDQEEALTMSDRVAVFNHGKIVQIGTPTEIYEQPATGFVAGFVGTSNIIPETEAEKMIGIGKAFSIRPEKIRISANAIAAENGEAYTAQGVIRDVIYLGMHTRYLVTLDSGMDMIVVQQNLETNSDETVGSRGSRVNLVWEKQHIRYLSV
jgi:putative spermidine/putrescine transport system ATP-binding protein